MPQFNPSYIGPRGDLVALLPASCRALLDVGCATGALGAGLKAQRPGARVVGIEVDPAMAAEAERRLDRTIVGDVERWDEVGAALADHQFDCIVCGDVLEHLRDPWTALDRLVTLLEPGGYVLLSLPNIGHADQFVNTFVRKRWAYRERGIHDRTHLRFFARRNVTDLVEQAGLELVELRRTYRLIERPHGLNRFARFAALPGLRDLLTFQFLVLARRPG